MLVTVILVQATIGQRDITQREPSWLTAFWMLSGRKLRAAIAYRY